MTMDEVKRLLELNMNNYPGRFLKDATTEQLEDMANSWYVVFAEADGRMVLAAYMEALRRCSFPVTIADIWQELEKTMPTPQVESEWQALVKAADWCHAQSYCQTFTGPSQKYPGLTQAQEYERDCKALFDSLSEINQNFIGNVRRLRELGSRDGKEQDFWFVQRYKPAFEDYQRLAGGRRVLALAEKQGARGLLT